MRKYYCDRCGEEIITRGPVKLPSPMQMRWRDIPTETNPTAWESEWKDLCGKCANAIRMFISNNNMIVWRLDTNAKEDQDTKNETERR